MSQRDGSPAFNLYRLKKMRDELGHRSNASKAKAAFTSPTAFVGSRKKDDTLHTSVIEAGTNDNNDDLENRDDILNQIAVTTSVNVRNRSRSNTPVKRVTRVQTPELIHFTSTRSESSRTRAPTPEGRREKSPGLLSRCPASPRVQGKDISGPGNNCVEDDSDLQFNDNAFLVVATMILSLIRPKLSTEHDSYTLTKEEMNEMNSLLPISARRAFVNALRFRSKFLPKASENNSPVNEAVRECVGLGLDRPDDKNLVLGGGQMIAGGRVYVPNIRQAVKPIASDSSVTTSRSRLQIRTNLSSSQSFIGDDAGSTRSRSRSVRIRTNLQHNSDADDNRSTRSRSRSLTRPSPTFASDDFRSRSQSRSPRSFKRFVPIDQRTDGDGASILSSGSRMSRASRISRSSVMTPRQRRANKEVEDEEAKERINKREEQIEAQMKSLRDAQEMLAKQQMEFQKKQMEIQQQQLKEQKDQLFEIAKLKTMHIATEMIEPDEANDENLMDKQDKTDLADVNPDFSWMKDLGVTEDEINDVKQSLPKEELQQPKKCATPTSRDVSPRRDELSPTMQILQGVKHSFSSLFRLDESEIKSQFEQMLKAQTGSLLDGISQVEQTLKTQTDDSVKGESQAKENFESITENQSRPQSRSSSTSVDPIMTRGSFLEANKRATSSHQSQSSYATGEDFGIEINSAMLKPNCEESCNQSTSVGSVSRHRYIQDLNFDSGSITTKGSRCSKSAFTVTSKCTHSTNGANAIEIDSAIMEEYKKHSQQLSVGLDTMTNNSYMRNEFSASGSIQTRSTQGSTPGSTQELKSVAKSVASSTKDTINTVSTNGANAIEIDSVIMEEYNKHLQRQSAGLDTMTNNSYMRNEFSASSSIQSRSTRGSMTVSKSVASSVKSPNPQRDIPPNFDSSTDRSTKEYKSANNIHHVESTDLLNSSASISCKSQISRNNSTTSEKNTHSVASSTDNTNHGSIHTRLTQGSKSGSKSVISSAKDSIASTKSQLVGDEGVVGVYIESTDFQNSSASISRNSHVSHTHSTTSNSNTSLCSNRDGVESRRSATIIDSKKANDAPVIKEWDVDDLSADASAYHSIDSTSYKSLGLSKVSEMMEISKVAKLRAEIEETKILLDRAGSSDAKRFWQLQVEELQARLDEEITTQLQTQVQSALSVEDEPAIESDLSTNFVNITAPSDFPAGYMFEARFDDRRFLAVVPHGGVKKGETFNCKFTEFDSSLCHVPKYNWRDGFFGILSNGVNHPFFLISLLFPLLAVGQVMTRMKLNWLGKPASGFESIGVQSMMSSVMFLSLFVNIVVAYVIFVHFTRGLFIPLDFIVLGANNFFLYLFTAYVIARTRKHIRETYMIRQAFVCEDVIKAIFLMPFTLSQMGRHTADYAKYTAYFCTPTGLANYVIWNPELDGSSSYTPPLSQEQESNCEINNAPSNISHTSFNLV